MYFWPHICDDTQGFSNEPLKDLTIERKKVEEFEESLR